MSSLNDAKQKRLGTLHTFKSANSIEDNKKELFSVEEEYQVF